MTTKEWFFQNALGAGGWIALLGKLGFDVAKNWIQKRKVNSEAENLDIDTDTKAYEHWKKALMEMRDEFQAMSERVLKLEQSDLKNKTKIQKLTEENRALKEQVSTFETELGTWKKEYQELEEKYLAVTKKKSP